MAMLDTLAICGIRSFGHETRDEQRIKFDKPLTLILGENGCGKSTIIECLRYVTAQKDPTGKSVLVRDPQYSQQNTIKGFIKLRMLDQRGLQVHLSRAVQATRTAKSLTMKHLDSTFTREDPNTGELISISNRCADFTPEVLKVFGVSKAIIENVIFCTQEDSLWPLDTDQKLKEKFDQIFDSEKYNKCTKKIRDKRKKLMDEEKKFEIELTYLKENKNAAEFKQNQIKSLENNVKKLNNQIDQLNADLTPIEQGLKEIYKKEVEVSKLFTKCETTKTNLLSVEKSESELRNKIKVAACEFLGNDDDLEKALKECDKVATNTIALKEELVTANEQEKLLAKEIRTSVGQVGELKKVSELNAEKISDKNAKMRSLATNLGVETSNLSEDLLELKVEAKESDFQENRRKIELEQEENQSKIDKANEKVFAQDAIVKLKTEALEDNKRETKKLKREMDDVEASQAKFDRISSSLKNATAELTEHQNRSNSDELRADVRRWQSDLNKVEETLTEVEGDVQILQEQTSVLRELELQREAYADKTAVVRRLKNEHEDTILEILGTIPDTGFRQAVECHVDLMTRQFRDLQNQQQEMGREIATLDEKQKHLKRTLRSKRDEVQELTEKILNETGGDDWERAVQEQRKIVDELQDTKGTLTSSSCMYQRYIRALQRSNPCCPLCSRDFNAEEEARKLAQELADKMRDVPNRIRDNQRELDEKQDKLNKLLALQSIQDRVAVLKSDIPVSETELETIELNLSRLRKELAEVVSKKQKPEKTMKLCAGIQSDLTLLDQATTDERKLLLEVEKLETRMPSTGPKKNLREMLAQQDSLRHDRKNSRNKLEDAQLRLQKHNDTLQILQTTKHNLAEEMRTMEGGGSARKALEERCFDLQGIEAILIAELQTAREAMFPLEHERTMLMNDHKQLKEKHKRDIEIQRKKVDGLKTKLDEIRRLQREISAFQLKGFDAKLQDLENKLKKLEEEARSVRDNKESLSARIGDMSKNEVRRRELEDNKSLRIKTSEKEELRSELNELQKTVGSGSFDEIIKEKRKLKNEEENIGQEKATAHGRIGALSAQIGSLEDELKNKQFAKIHENYKKTLIKKTLCDSIAADLMRYATCMEYVMGVYHGRQMENVNAFAREYWRTIYQGNDIDYIQILTEECKVSEHRRSYTYRLVQAKGDVLMDMRNRCSAGQKMLAALIIRMALSEVFSHNCGILTLDEPTTNLDSKNVRNLARTLSEVISNKQNALHSNFQLIVITHDEEFVRELVEIHGTQTCVRVWRDHEGKSKTAVKRIHKDASGRESVTDREDK